MVGYNLPFTSAHCGFSAIQDSLLVLSLNIPAHVLLIFSCCDDMACSYILLGDPDFRFCFVSSLNSLESPVTTAWLQLLDSVLGSPLPSFASQIYFLT